MEKELKNLQIAHRGIHNNIDIPENSLKAFEKCLQEKMPIELDVQLTKDDALVVFHDESLQRMTGIDALVKNKTLDELKQLFLGKTKEKIPTFKEVLDLVQGKVLLDIEIKHTKAVKKICTLVIKELENYGDNYIIKSFDPVIIKYFAKYPNIIKGLLIKDDYHNRILNSLLKSKLIIKYCHPDFLAISKKMLKDKKWLQLSKDYPTFIWTIKTLKEKEKYLDLQVNYICNMPLKK